jgi:hypothetical protein
MAIRVMDGFDVSESLKLGVGWCDIADIQCINDHFAAVSNKRKGMLRYDIYLDAGNEFKISKRIIGSKGSHMKRILDSVKGQCSMGLAVE